MVEINDSFNNNVKGMIEALKRVPRENSKKASDKAELRNAIASIKQAVSDKKMPSSDDLGKIRELAAKYSGDPEFANLLASAEKAFKMAEEVASQELYNSQRGGKSSYTPEQYKNLLKKENAYFNDAKTQERHNLIDKMAAGGRINDNDPSGQSITTKEFTNFINDNSSEDTKTKRQEASELLAHDAGKFKEKQEASIPLTPLEEERKQQVHERIEKVTQEEIYEAIFQKHKRLHAIENQLELATLTTEEVIKARGNSIIEEVAEVYPKIKQAFKGSEEKLAALMFHNPKALHEHHDNIKQLQIEAEKAHQQQKQFERTKEAENIKEARKEQVAVVAAVTDKRALAAEVVTSKGA